MRAWLYLVCLPLLQLSTAAAADLEVRTWTVDGVTREALIHLPPPGAGPAPLVLVFHGHGGSMRAAARSFGLHRLWPAAVVVYPQGLNTPGKLTDPEGKRSGWQSGPGDQGDRDLALVDAMLLSLKNEGRVDPRRIYATGHSNGGGFTYLLWTTRGDVFAAFAPSAASFSRSAGRPDRRDPRPLLHFASRDDPLVRFAWQERSVALARQINQCTGPAQPWPPGGPEATLFPSAVGAPVIFRIAPGGHAFSPDAPALMVRFFQDHTRPDSTSPER